MNDTIRLKIALVYLSVSVSLLLLIPRYIGRIYPTAPFLSLIAMVGFVSLLYPIDSDERWWALIIVGIGVLAVVHRFSLFVYPPSMIGMDPDSFALHVQSVIETGGVDEIGSLFYRRAPLSATFAAIYAIIARVAPYDALGIYTVLLGIIVPASGGVMAAQVDRSNRVVASIFGALIGAVATISVSFGFKPHPQVLAVSLWCLFVLALIKYSMERSWRGLFLLLLSVAAMGVTHKLPLIISCLSVLLVALAYYHLDTPAPTNGRTLSALGGVVLLLIVGLAAFVQLGYVTNFFDVIVLKSVALFDVQSTSPELQTTKAFHPAGGVLGIIFRRGHGLILLPVTIVCGLIVGYRARPSPGSIVLLSCSSLLLAITAFAVILPSVINPLRPLFFAEPVFVGLVGAVAASLSRVSKLNRVLVFVFVLFLVFTQLFSATAVPNSPDHPREYLTGSEISAKDFGRSYATSPIGTDYYASRETIPSGIVGQDPSSNYFRSDMAFYLNGTFRESLTSYHLYRTDVRTYRSTQGNWELTWNPESALDDGYDKVYENGGGKIYLNSSTASTPR